MIESQDRRQKLQAAFLELSLKGSPVEITPISGDASFRHYYRVTQGEKRYVLMDAPPKKEDVRKYLVVSEFLGKHSYSVPHVLASDIHNGFLLLEDMGDNLFSRVIREQEESTRREKEQELYEAAIDVLVTWNYTKNMLVTPDQIQMRNYDTRLLLEEAELFAKWYLPQIMGKEKAAQLHEEYMVIWQSIFKTARLACDHLVHRDYHADNLMWLPERKGVKRVGLLDFQDAVYGDAAYDVVSLLEDARRDVSSDLVRHCMFGYLYATKKNKDRFMTAYSVLGAQRNCKIIGIFVRLAVRDHKQNYIELLPRVWQHLEKNLKSVEMDPLRVWMDKHVSAEFRGAIPIKMDAAPPHE